MLTKDCDYIVYNVWAKDNTFFQADFEYEENAQKYCDYLSKRDNEEYFVKETLLCIGMPNYVDEEMLKLFENKRV